MTNQRKYFEYKIAQLENLFEESRDNIGILEEIEKELKYRKTKRAKNLLRKVQSNSTLRNKPKQHFSNHSENVTVSPVSNSKEDLIHERQLVQDIIDWQSVLDQEPEEHLKSEQFATPNFTNKPIDILESWISIEAFSPQTYKYPKDLQGNGSIAYFNDGEPWLQNEKSRPRCNLYYIIYLGALELEKVTKKLISVYQDKRIERPNVQGKAALGAILVDKQGIPIPDKGIALSSFGWSYGQVLTGYSNRIKYWERAEKKTTRRAE